MLDHLKKMLAGRSLPSPMTRISVDWKNKLLLFITLCMAQGAFAMQSEYKQQRLDKELIKILLFNRKMQKIEEAIKELICEGANVSKLVEAFNTTTLHLAVQQGDMKIVRLLLETIGNIEQVADLDVVDGLGNTLLSFAIHEGNLPIVRLLLSKGADVNKFTGPAGVTPLILAAHRENYEIVKLLLDYKAGVNIQSVNSNTSALHWAAAKGNARIVRLLLKRGADRNLLDIQGRTPSLRAAQRGHAEVVRILSEEGCET